MKVRDQERADFIQHFFKRDINEPEGYDLTINSGCFDVDEMAEIVLLAYDHKVGREVPRIG